MNEEEVRKRIKDYFGIHELVGKRTFRKYGERAWRFLDYRLLYALLIVREGIGLEITVNSWRIRQRIIRGGSQQRGLRTIVQQMIKNYFYKDKLYVSPHLMGKAVDFDVKGKSAGYVRGWIVTHQELFPFKIRLEDKVSWIHMDVVWEEKNSNVYLFQPPK